MIYDEQIEYEANDGLGFLGPAVAAGAAGGPIGAAIGAAIAGIAALFGFGFGGDDQATTYRPPPNSGEIFVSFSDQLGDEDVAYRVDSESLAEAARRGNRAEDIYSYYSAFISGNTRSGASEAAARVVEDAARNNGVSIPRAADLILKIAGIFRIARPRTAPRPSVATGTQGQCPPGYTPNYTTRRCDPAQYPFTPQAGASSEIPWWVYLLAGLVVVQIVKD